MYQLDDLFASALEMRDSETLPDRAAMSLVNANLARSRSVSRSLELSELREVGNRCVLSDWAIAAATALQATPISLVVCGGRRRGAGKASRDRAVSART